MVKALAERWTIRFFRSLASSWAGKSQKMQPLGFSARMNSIRQGAQSGLSTSPPLARQEVEPGARRIRRAGGELLPRRSHGGARRAPHDLLQEARPIVARIDEIRLALQLRPLHGEVDRDVEVADLVDEADL